MNSTIKGLILGCSTGLAACIAFKLMSRNPSNPIFIGISLCAVVLFSYTTYWAVGDYQRKSLLQRMRKALLNCDLESYRKWLDKRPSLNGWTAMEQLFMTSLEALYYSLLGEPHKALEIHRKIDIDQMPRQVPASLQLGLTADRASLLCDTGLIEAASALFNSRCMNQISVCKNNIERAFLLLIGADISIRTGNIDHAKASLASVENQELPPLGNAQYLSVKKKVALTEGDETLAQQLRGEIERIAPGTSLCQ